MLQEVSVEYSFLRLFHKLHEEYTSDEEKPKRSNESMQMPLRNSKYKRESFRLFFLIGDDSIIVRHLICVLFYLISKNIVLYFISLICVL